MNDKNGKMEPDVPKSADVPSYTAELGTRIALAIERVGGVRTAAKFAGASEDTLANWRDGKARPSFFGMQGLANAAKIRLEWLANGDAPMENQDHGGPRPGLDEDLMGRLVDGITAAYKDAGHGLAPIHLGRMTARLANEIIAVADGPEDYPGALKMRLAQLRRDLQTAGRDQASDKRLA